MNPRFFSDNPIRQPSVALAGDEAHHLLHVMRGKIGDSVVLFDGTGGHWEATIESLGRTQVQLRVENFSDQDLMPKHHLTLAVSLPKGDRQKWLIEKLTELGIARLLPLITERSVAQPTESACERLRRNVIAACKQCGRNRLMEIGPAVKLRDLVAETGLQNSRRLIAHPVLETNATEASTTSDIGSASSPVEPKLTIAMIGPEGGFAPDEVRLANRAGWQPIRLGQRILRVETAAVALASVLLGEIG